MPLLHNCDTLAGVTVTSGGTIVVDNVDFVEGLGSLRALAVAGASDFTVVIRNPGSQENWTLMASLDIKVKDDGVSTFALYLNAPDSANRFFVNLKGYIFGAGVWLNPSIPRSAFGVSAGNPSWDRVVSMVFRAWTYGAVAGYRLDDIQRVDGVSGAVLTIEASPLGTTSPAPGAHTYTVGQSVSVLATPSAGYILDHWELDGFGVGAANPYVVVMDANHALNPVFAPALPPTHIVTINANTVAGGIIRRIGEIGMSFTVPYTDLLEEGVWEVEMDAVAVDGSVFGYWEDDLSTNRIRQFQVSQDVSLFAVYVSPSPPTQGILTVDTTPVKGAVYVDGFLWGTAPVSRTIDAGAYVVSFGPVSGYTTPSSLTANIVAGAETSVLGTYVEAPPPPPTQGILMVNTTPVSGQIFVNGQSWGMAPQTRQVDPGSYLVSFGDVTGYVKPTDITANVTAGEETDVTGVYTAIPPPTQGVLSVDTTPVKGEVLVNGSPWGVAPQSRPVEPGSYLVSFGDMGGYTRPSDHTAVVTADMETTVMGTYTPIPTQQGVLSIRAYYDTMEVTAPTEVVGIGSYVTPVQLPLNPGTYTVNSTYQSQQQSKSASVVSGQTTNVEFQFTSIPPPPPPPPPEPILPNVRKVLYPIVPGAFDRWDERRKTGAQRLIVRRR